MNMKVIEKDNYKYVMSTSGLIAYDKSKPMTIRFNRQETNEMLGEEIDYSKYDHHCEVAHLEISNTCNMDCKYCVEGSTKILMADFTLRDIKDIKIGDIVIGFDEFKNVGEYAKYYPTKVTGLMNREAMTIRLRPERGNDLLITDEHPLLCSGHRWRKPESFKEAEIRYFPIVNDSDTIETYEYKLGYLKGICEGDGSFGEYKDKRNGKTLYKFKLDMIDNEALDRTRKYIKDLFCVDVKSTNPQIIRLDDKSSVASLRSAIQWKKKATCMNTNMCIGYLAGIFDAEGSLSESLRIANKTDKNTVGYNIEYSLMAIFKNEWIKESTGYRILGGYKSISRFFKLTKPAISRKINKLHNRSIPETRKVTKKYGKKCTVYNIETESHTYVANGFCVHNCYVPNKNGGEIDGDSWRHILRNLSASGIFQVSFGGGEPTLRRDILELADYVKELGMNLGMTTNGGILRQLPPVEVRKYFKQINVSWHNSMKIFKDALQYLHDNDIPAGINYCYSHELAIRNEIIKDMAREYNAEILYLVYKPVDGDVKNQISPNEVYKAAKQAANEGLRVAVDGPAVKSCLMKRKFIDVNHKGIVFPCSFVRKPMGNLLTEDFKDIWHNRGPQNVCPWIDLVTGNCISHVGEVK